MPTGRRVALISLMLALLLGTLGTIYAVNYTNSVEPSASVGDSLFVSEMKTCNQDRWDFFTLKLDEVFQCQDKVLQKYVAGGKLSELDSGLDKLSQQHPTFWLPCHDLLHKTGESQVSSIKNGVDLLSKINRATCQGGLVHGVLDGLARLTPTEAQFVEIGATCDAYSKLQDSREAGRLTYYCADGMGHAAWSSGKNLEQAVRRCDSMVNDWQSSTCAEGVLMQMFEPANDEASYSLEYAYENLANICDSWPTDNRVSPSLTGCHKGAAYVYTRAARKIDLELNNKNPDLSQELSEVDKKKLYDSLVFAKNQCDKHTDADNISLCYEGISWQIPTMFFLTGEYVDMFCSQLGEHDETCATVNSTRWTEQDSLIVS